MTGIEPDVVRVGVPAGSTVTVTVTVPVVHQCPFRDETDEGTATITWVAGPDTLELHSLTSWLDSLHGWKVSHEEFTHHLRLTLARFMLGGRGMRPVTVTTTWETAGAAITVVSP